jgi:hypothetical protein
VGLRHGDAEEPAAIDIRLRVVDARRRSDKKTLINQIAAWEKYRNKRHTKADWQFATDDAALTSSISTRQFE